MDYEANQKDWQISYQANEEMTSRIRPSLVKTEILLHGQQGKFLACWRPHLHHCASSTSQCSAVHQEIHVFTLTPPLLPHVSAACPSRASRGEFSIKCFGWIYMAMGETNVQTSTHIWRMHRDAQSYTMPLKYVAVYMYTMSSMYSLRCCTLHVDL